MRNSSWTGKAPRSMQGAFGPYTDSRVYGPESRFDRIGAVLFAVALGIVGAIVLVTWICS